MENPAASCKQGANKIKLNYERNSLILEQEKKMRKNRIALLLGIVLMLSLVLTGCRSAGKTVQPSYEGESFTENFNTPKPTPTPAPEGEAAEKLSTQDALKQK